MQTCRVTYSRVLRKNGERWNSAEYDHLARLVESGLDDEMIASRLTRPIIYVKKKIKEYKRKKTLLQLSDFGD